MSIVKVVKNTYTAEPLYQWDINQKLQVYGLALARVPEVHFSNAATSRAIPRQATMDAAGVITVDVPNSLLQKPYAITAHVCGYNGATCETLYKLEIPVRERPKPADYTLQDDPEVYSFNALENAVVNATRELQNAEQAVRSAETTLTNAVNNLGGTVADEVNKQMDAAVDDKVNNAVAGMLDDTLTDETKAANAKATGVALANMEAALSTQIAAQVATRARVVVGTYEGAGKFGSSNKNELTFDGELLAICINDPVEGDGVDTLYGGYTWVKGSAHGKVSEYLSADLTWADNGVKWWNNYGAGAKAQLNTSGKKYPYVAFLKEADPE